MALELKPMIEENTRRRMAIRELLNAGKRPNCGVLREALLTAYSITATNSVITADLREISRDNDKLEAWRNATAYARRQKPARKQTPAKRARITKGATRAK
jgi:hypothetical protein